jgi:ABC-2 type transport system ATP-binding protein
MPKDVAQPESVVQIQATNLRKTYGEVVAVDQLSLEVFRGEAFGLLGPNGAGKTTTIHMLTGILRPDAGQVTLGESDPANPAARRNLGVAPQQEALYGELTGAENLRFFGRMYGLRGKHLAERVAWALEFVGLTDRGRDYAETYSGGMRQRLNVACALVHDPAILFLDEPTVGIDPQSRNHLLDSIASLAREGRTILYTTHYMEEAQRLCKRVGIIDKGKLVALDTVENLIARHGGSSRVEAQLAGPPPSGIALPGPLVDLKLIFESDNPFETALQLSAAGVQFQSFHVERPNLEKVFLNLTGKELRD